MALSLRLILVSLVILACVFLRCECYDSSSSKFKFLIYTAADDGSHHMHHINIAKSLIKQGHQVTFLLSSSCLKWMHTDDAHLFTFIVYQSVYTPSEREELSRRFSMSVMNGEFTSLTRSLSMLFRCERPCPLTFPRDECSHLLGDKIAIKQMLDGRFHMLIGDDLTWCNPLLAHKLGVKFVLYSSKPLGPAKYTLLYGLPQNPAYIPERQLGLSDNMSFRQRAFNAYMHFVYKALFYILMRSHSSLQYEHDVAPEVPTLELMGRAELVIFTMDFGLEFARPLPPNVLLISPALLGVEKSVQVPQDQQDFVDNATVEGVVLFSLGTHVSHMANDTARIFARGLAKLKQKVLWHFPGNISHLPLGNNTMVVKWIPMKTFMAHRNVRAVICHGGGGTLHEAAWFGLPVIGIPLFADQFDNMIRAVGKGIGLSLNLREIKEDSLYQVVTKVIEDPSFRAKSQKLSGILREEMLSPADKAASWISHVTRFGCDHLRPKVMDMGFIQANLLDVYGFCLLLSIVVLFLSVSICRC